MSYGLVLWYGGFNDCHSSSPIRFKSIDDLISYYEKERGSYLFFNRVYGGSYVTNVLNDFTAMEKVLEYNKRVKQRELEWEEEMKRIHEIAEKVRNGEIKIFDFDEKLFFK